jgi:hypothetical protein
MTFYNFQDLQIKAKVFLIGQASVAWVLEIESHHKMNNLMEQRIFVLY